MFISLLLGLTGSLGHCSGMCGGIVLLLNRALGERATTWAWVQVHAGRLFTYSLLGLAAGFLGSALRTAADTMQVLQGGVALYAAILGIYFALVLFGRAPSPENIFPGAVRAWRRMFERTSTNSRGTLTPAFGLGMAWGLLPCGLVLAALFTATVDATPLEAALRMAVFGTATLPVLSAVRWLSTSPASRNLPRYGAAIVVLLFSFQTGLRSLAAFGLVDHFMVGQVVLW